MLNDLDNSNMWHAFLEHQRVWKDGHQYRIDDQLIEEMAELTKALLKKRRGLGGDQEIKDEIVDVCICLEFLGRSLPFRAAELAREADDKAGELLDRLQHRVIVTNCDGSPVT